MIAVITGVRRIRAESNVPPSKPLPSVILIHDDPAARASLEKLRGYIARMAKVEEITITDSTHERPDNCGATVENNVEILVPLGGLIDVAAERARIEGQLEKIQTEIARITKKLSNERFVQNAAPEVVDADRKKLADAEEKRAALEAGLARLR